MLGWSLNIYPETGDKYEKSYGYWVTGAWDAIEWVNQAVKDGNGSVIELHGGYPNVYRVASSYVPEDKITRGPILEEMVIVEMWDQS